MKHLLVYHDGYVKIEYQHAGTRTRISTGVAIPSKAYLKANNELKSTVKDYESKQKIINSLHKKADDIITEHFQKFQAQPTGDQFKRAWVEYDTLAKESKELLNYYDRFYKYKENEFKLAKYNEDSIKDYRNIRFYLEDFITYKKKPIYLDDIGKEWMNSFVSFMETERLDYDKSRKNGGKYWSKGKLAGSTVKKRIALFLGFLNWLDDEQLFEMPKGLKNYYGTLEDSDAVKATITKEEANRLYKHDFNEDKSNFIKDIFVFACFTGMRWEDICSFNRKDLTTQAGVGLIIEKKAKKTKGVFRVPVNTIVHEIILRYGYNLYQYDNANFNKYLKLLLAETGWFSDETKFLDDDGNYKKRWQCLSIHRGRDSFISMLLNDRVPINQIMKYTGHITVSSLNMYIDLKSQIENHTNALVTI